MKSDEAAAKIVRQEWSRVRGKDPENDEFFGLVKIGDVEFKRFKIAQKDFIADRCMPCQSTIKKLRDQIAKGIREVYGE